MTDTPNIPPEEPGFQFLADAKRDTLARVVSFMSGVGMPVKNSYPLIEVDTWAIQGPEASKVIALGHAEVLTKTQAQLEELAPFLLLVCTAHHGEPTDDAQRAQRLWDKAISVKGNADVWLSIAAYVNGLRARVSDLLDAATTPAQVYEIEANAQSELSAFRAQFLPLQV